MPDIDMNINTEGLVGITDEQVDEYVSKWDMHAASCPWEDIDDLFRYVCREMDNPDRREELQTQFEQNMREAVDGFLRQLL